MRKVFSILASLVISYTVVAQPGGGRTQMTGSMYGKLIEAKSSKPIEYASVQLIQSKYDSATKKRKDVNIAGMLSESNGDFRLENIPLMGQYKLKVSIIGYKPYEQTVSFDFKRPEGDNSDPTAMLSALDKDLGNILIDVEDKVLDNVTITSEKPGLQLAIDKKVFNVDKNITSVGGTAVDVMRNVPSLNVDIDGNVSLRNNSPQIFVDGRPTTMELDQIPADAIESVEIITNPSAKFDASGGTAGILNIILKKNRKVGYNGSIRTNIDSRAKIGLGADLNVRQNKINAFVSANFNQRRSIGTGNTERLSLIDNPNNILYQDDRSEFDGHFLFGRAGIDYFVTNRTTLSASINIGNGKFMPMSWSNLLTDTLSNPVKTSLTKRVSDMSREFNNLGASFSFKHNFPKVGRELTADINYRNRTGPSDNFITTTFYNPDLTTVNYEQLQRQVGDGDGSRVVIQSDFVNPINDKSKMEMGVRAAFNDNSNNSAFYSVDPNTGEQTLQPASQVDYSSTDRVLAAYTTYTSKIKDFGYQLGLRIESSNYQGVLNKTNEKFNIDFPVSLFPSVFLSQKFKGDNELQLNYSRRINRPNFWQLTPFVDSTDFLNLSKGNPGLNPEFTNSLELSYQKIFKNRDNMLITLYYKNTNDLITRYQQVETEPVTGKDQIINTYINANSSYVTGLEIILKNNITKWWELTSNFNLFTSKIKIDDPTIPQQDQFASWFTKINNSFKITKKLSFQLSGSYQSKTILPPGGSGSGGRGGFGGMFGQSTSAQGYVRPIYYVDAAIRYNFLKDNRASLSVNMNDIFRTNVSDVHSESPYFIQDVFRRRDPQVVRINFSWRFGKFDASLFKRKNNRNNNDGGMDDMNIGQKP
ncbi:MAG TPA: TonB-dependent receptor [Chitinophagaceae bacterium]|nr:TonB-dependent receptor [Chitinophagaceae bacterium]